MSPSTDSDEVGRPVCPACSSIRSIRTRRRLGAYLHLVYRPSCSRPPVGQRLGDHGAGAGTASRQSVRSCSGCPRRPSASPSRGQRPSPACPTGPRVLPEQLLGERVALDVGQVLGQHAQGDRRGSSPRPQAGRVESPAVPHARVARWCSREPRRVAVSSPATGGSGRPCSFRQVMAMRLLAGPPLGPGVFPARPGIGADNASWAPLFLSERSAHENPVRVSGSCLRRLDPSCMSFRMRHVPDTDGRSRTVANPFPPQDLGGDSHIPNTPPRAGGVGAHTRPQHPTTRRAQRGDPDSHIVSIVVVSCD
jgi:hypothetical protein